MNNNVNNLILEILKESANGSVIIKSSHSGDWKFNIKFFSEIEGKSNAKNRFYPILKVPDLKLLNQKLSDYLEVAKPFFKQDISRLDLDSEESYEKMLITFLFANATFYDFANPINFIETRKNLIENEIDLGFFEIGNYIEPEFDKLKLGNVKIVSRISKNSSSLEAPYSFRSNFQGVDYQEFYLPKITFGLDGDTVYIYAVQGKKYKQQDNFSKKIDRYLRKINDGVPQNSIESEVSPSAVASLTIFLSEMQKQGIKNVIVPNFLPVRYNSNKITAFRKMEEGQDYSNVVNGVYRDANSATSKLMYLFLRYNYHFESANAEYNEDKQQLEMVLNNKFSRGNKIIYYLNKLPYEKEINNERI